LHDKLLVGNWILKEEGRRKKEEGRRKKEEGRRKKEEGISVNLRLKAMINLAFIRGQIPLNPP